MTVLFLLFLLLGAVCFGLAALGVVVRQINLVALGLFFWILVPLVGTLSKL